MVVWFKDRAVAEGKVTLKNWNPDGWKPSSAWMRYEIGDPSKKSESSKERFRFLFELKKKAILIIKKLNFGESCGDALRKLK